MGRGVGIALTLIGLIAVLVCGPNFRELRLGPPFLVLGVAAIWSGLFFLFSKKAAPLSLGVVAVACTAGFLYWRTFGPGPLSLAEADRLLVVFVMGTVALCGAARGIGGKVWDRGLLGSLGLLALAQGGAAAFQTWGDSTWLLFEADVREDQQASGLMTHHNPFSGLMVGVAGYALAAVYFLKSGWRVTAGIVLLLCLGGLIFSQSRGGSIAMGVCLAASLALICAAKHSRKASDTWKVVWTGVLGLIVAIIAVSFYLNYLEGERGKELLNGGVRPSLAKQAINFYLAEPILGQGARAFSYLSPQNWTHAISGWSSGMPGFAHNEYFEMLVSYGTVGLLAVVVVLALAGFSGLFQLLGSRPLEPEQQVVTIGALAGLAGFLTQCFFSFLAHVPTNLGLAALHLGVLFAWWPRKKSGISKLLTKISGLVLLASAVWFGWTGWHLTKAWKTHTEAQQEPVTPERIAQYFEVGETTKQSKYFVSGAARALTAAVTDSSNASEWADLALKGYRRAYELNPEAPEPASGLGVTYDFKGELAEARSWHEKAVHNGGPYLSVRMGFAQPFGQHLLMAATQGFAEDPVQAEKDLREAEKRLRGGRYVGEATEAYQTRVRQRRLALGWISYLEAKRLYETGYEAWRKKRQAARGMALMLSAEKRYKSSKSTVSSWMPNWQAEWDQLQTTLKFLKGARIEPAQIEEEQVKAIAEGPNEDSLARDKATR